MALAGLTPVARGRSRGAVRRARLPSMSGGMLRTTVHPMSQLTRFVRSSARDATRAAVRDAKRAVTRDPTRITRRTTVDPHWRRLEDGGAARLSPGELIAPGRPVGRWHGVDPHRPADGWRSVWKFAGLLGWAGAVGGAWWLGHSRERGPLAAVAQIDRIGESVGAAVAGFDELD